MLRGTRILEGEQAKNYTKVIDTFRRRLHR